MNRKTLFLAALGILLVTFVFGTSFYFILNKGKVSATPQANQESLVRMHSPALGKIDAPVVIVEFFDPACETCAAFYPRVKQMMAANPDRIRLVLRYTPFHVGSDKVVALLEATRKQGLFWQALEALLKSQSQWVVNHTAQPGLAWKPLEGLGLDFEKLRADMEAPEVARVIAQDMEDARALNVTKTPEYFVNGKPLPSFGFEQLKKLVDDALKG
jgi:protein-disulfide isomerase